MTATDTLVIEFHGDIASNASNISIVTDVVDDSVRAAELFREAVKISEQENALGRVIDHARSQGLQEFADRLAELGRQPLAEDEIRIQAESALHFVEYCDAREKQSRPLMTVTPTGELDATWQGPDEQNQVMRFFPNGTVWVAYKLSGSQGSFQARLTKLLSADFDYNIPDWA